MNFDLSQQYINLKHISIGAVDMRVATWAVVSFVLVSSVLVGCLDNNDVDDVEIVDDKVRNAYSIVAPIDTGINVYHNHFILNETLQIGCSRV